MDNKDLRDRATETMRVMTRMNCGSSAGVVRELVSYCEILEKYADIKDDKLDCLTVAVATMRQAQVSKSSPAAIAEAEHAVDLLLPIKLSGESNADKGQNTGREYVDRG